MNLELQNKVDECVREYGKQVVDEVLEMIELSDADGLWSMYNDLGLYNHAEVVEHIFFNF